MNERLKEIRNYLNLSQEDFGEKIGIKSRAHISLLESGSRKLTNRTLADICREFNVNENWLRTGEGEMFEAISESAIDNLAKEYKLNPLAKKIVESFVTLEEKEMNFLLNIIGQMASNIHDEIAVAKNDEDNIERELESYRLELEAEKRGQTSSVSQITKEENKNIG